jgi:uncharacterized ferredoxin-like protein
VLNRRSQLSVSPALMYSSGISDDAKMVIDSEILSGILVSLTFQVNLDTNFNRWNAS